MDFAEKLKADLIALAEQSRSLSNQYLAVAASMRYQSEQTIRELLNSSHGGGGIEEIIGLALGEVSGRLAWELKSVRDAVIDQAERFQRSKDTPR